ncbi:unnamed protein product [Bursaphelenchus okinawaensis]|uniref:Protein sleepless n=1 Tax=Bursaphelenchus okinawaensis TaxID=465554 RepID=A0A811JW65_9BILA|nr:unnamed protein product [Bursaphelenchus okinawaensis]CAG9085874.1 unnamed protein product [Bursaphelenchus okinawaensis]
MKSSYNNLLTITVLTTYITPSYSINCLQCSGWNGRGYAPRHDTINPCDNPNNACSTGQFCVKIIDPIFHGTGYKTYKSDCYASTTFSSTTNTSTIESGRCYNYTDGGNPPKTFYYCFCNNRDYCNSAPSLSIFVGFPLILSILSYLLAKKL